MLVLCWNSLWVTQVTQKLFPFRTRQNLNSAQLTFQITTNTQHYLYRKIKVARKCKGIMFIFLSGPPKVYTTPELTHATSSHGPHQLHQHNSSFYRCTMNWVNELTHAAYFFFFPLDYYFQSTPVHNHVNIRTTGRRQQCENASGNDGTREWAARDILPQTHIKEITVKDGLRLLVNTLPPISIAFQHVCSPFRNNCAVFHQGPQNVSLNQNM